MWAVGIDTQISLSCVQETRPAQDEVVMKSSKDHLFDVLKAITKSIVVYLFNSLCVCVCVYTNIWSVCNHLFPHHIWILSTMYDDKRIVERYTRRLGHITRHPAVKPSSSCCHCASVGRINRPIVRGLTATTYSPEKKKRWSFVVFFISTNGRSISIALLFPVLLHMHTHPSCLDYFFFDGKFVF